MAFSAMNISSQMMTFTGNKQPQLRIASKPVAGGSFTPNTLEAAFVLRSSLDYQFESAFLTKYKQLMQNRLNDLQKKLEDAYKNTLNTALGQQIGENAAASLRADVRLDGLDGSTNANLISGINGANGFEDLGIAPTTDLASWSDNTGNSQVAADRLNGTTLPNDNIAGYTRFIDSDPIHMRSLLEFTTAAGNVGGDINVTMRVEDDPPAPSDINSLLDALANLTQTVMGGPPEPTYFNQTIREETTQYKTGGFWSTLNYLYNFAPREMKYSYAVGYTAMSDEAGDDHMLIEGKLVDIRDNVYFPNEDPTQNHADDDPNIFTSGSRVKWASFDPIQGYQTEFSGTSGRYTEIVNRQNAWISGSSATNSGDARIGEQVWWAPNSELSTNPNALQHIVDGVHFESGTITYLPGQGIWGAQVDGNMGGPLAVDTLVDTQAGSTTTEIDVGAAGIGSFSVSQTVRINGEIRVVTEVDTTNDTITLNLPLSAAPAAGTDIFTIPQAYVGSNIQEGTIFRNKVEWNGAQNDARDGDNETTSRGLITSSLFFNHYEVETRTVEFNNGNREAQTGLGAGEIYVHGGIQRSNSVDASKSYNILKNPDGTESITRAAGNPGESFNGEFVQGLHKIHSVNGQDVASNSPKQANPVLGDFELGRYEGLYRAIHMSRNIVPYVPVTQTEVNASQVVPTDWHQSELLVAVPNDINVQNGQMWFPWTGSTMFSDAAGGYFSNVAAGAPQQVVQFRNAFNMAKDEFLELQPAINWITDNEGYLRPTYAKRDYFIDLELTGVHYNSTAGDEYENARVFVNGRELDVNDPTVYNIPPASVTPLGVNTADYTVQLNIGDFLKEGENIIVIQTADGRQINFPADPGDFREGVRVVEGTMGANDPVASNYINSVLLSGYSTLDQAKYNPAFERGGIAKIQSRWQSRIVPDTVLTRLAAGATPFETGRLGSLASDPDFTGTNHKVSNTFIEIIMQAINKERYRDIFTMGLWSKLNKLAIQGQASLPNQASLEGNLSIYFDFEDLRMVINQDKLIAKS